MRFKKREKNYEYEYLKNVILTLNKKEWTTKELEYIYKQYLLFLKRIKVEEEVGLRTGEVLLGKYCEVDYSDINDVKDLIYKCFDAIEEITPHVCAAIVGTMVKISLATINGELLDFNDVKEEQ